MAADDPHEFLNPQKSDDGEARELRAQSLELAAGEAFGSPNAHRKVCGALHLRYGDVTPEDLARASLSDDPDMQCARLGPLFKMCGLIGVGHEIERADVVRTIADAGPQSEGEMRLLFQVTAAECMAALCATDAMQPRQDLSVVSLQMNNYAKLTRLGLELRGGLQKLRSAQRPSLRLLDATPAPQPDPFAAVRHPKASTIGGEGHDPSEAEGPQDTGGDRG